MLPCRSMSMIANSQRQNCAMDKSDFPEFFALLKAYRSFRLFVARMTGFVALIYGAVTLTPYFFFLSLAAVVLFWIWDRMIDADNMPAEATAAVDPGER
jgi:hypothetical protein